MRIGLALALALLVGCSGESDKGSGEDELVPNMELANSNNFSFEGDFAFETTEIAPATDCSIDWSAMTTDIRGRAMVAEDVKQVSFLEFGLTQAEVLEKVEKNTLRMGDASNLYAADVDGVSTLNCSDFEILGNVLDVNDIVEDSTKSWLMSLVKVDQIGRVDILSTQFVTPKDAVTSAEVVFSDTSAALDASADLSSAPTIKAPTDQSDLILGWEGLTKDVNGGSFDPLLGDYLFIGHVAADVASVEGSFLRLYDDADQLYRLSSYGVQVARLSDAKDASGKSFSKFSSDGTWLIGIECSSCTSPVPLALAVVELE